MLSPLLLPRERKRIDLAQKNIAQSSWYFVASPTLAICPGLDRRTKMLRWEVIPLWCTDPRGGRNPTRGTIASVRIAMLLSFASNE
jgi:hypothetical protein